MVKVNTIDVSANPVYLEIQGFRFAPGDKITFTWGNNDEVKTFYFDSQPEVRYLKIAISENVRETTSGRHINIIKIPETKNNL